MTARGYYPKGAAPLECPTCERGLESNEHGTRFCGAPACTSTRLASELHALAIRAIGKWGAPNQVRQVQEECAELIAALNQHARGRIDAQAVASEIADVLITLAQACILFQEGLPAALASKIARLEQRLTECPVCHSQPPWCRLDCPKRGAP